MTVPMKLPFLLSLPERVIRAAFAIAGGGVYESAHLLLPRFVRESMLYEATAKNALRIAVEFLGGVDPAALSGAVPGPDAGRIAVQKTVGNVAELGAILAWGFSPLWLLAGASDVLNGSRMYLRTLEDELVAAGILHAGVRFQSIDQLLGALAGSAGRAGRLIDVPPLELEELRRAIADLRADASSLPTLAELAALFEGLVTTARAEQRPLLEVSGGIGLAFLNSARRVGEAGVLRPYREDWQPVHDEGFGAYAVRIARPYGRAAAGHFATDRRTLTERLPAAIRRLTSWFRPRRPEPPLNGPPTDT